MYIATFYSFKGGCGRTMALVNVAVDLAKRGRKVLIVDFDLEAPGVDTFPLLQPAIQRRGLVDLICNFLETDEVPDVTDFMYRCAETVAFPGELWIMPAGLSDEHYDSRFRSIDWQSLYREHEGFLLFEDIRAQWESLNLDYVLIDSRTGYTDTGGICTRQLPDCVFVFVFPNEQNRRGIESVVDQIRGETLGPAEKKIEIQFILSNVPNLDDEDDILASSISRIKAGLGFQDFASVLHHYDSLELVNQDVFTASRPKTRLSQEYKVLTNSLVRGNLSDREGALQYLDDTLRRMKQRSTGVLSSVEEQLRIIRAKHSSDVGVLKRLARIRQRQRKQEEALALLDRALEVGGCEPDVFILRAELNSQAGNKSDALTDLKRLLQLRRVSGFDLVIALRMLRELTPDFAYLLQDSPALREVDAEPELARELETSPATLPIAEALLRSWLASNSNMPELLRHELALCLIGLGKFKDAIAMLVSSDSDIEHLNIYDVFNFAMAKWGDSGELRADLCARVLTMSEEYKDSSGSNFLQCLAIAHWAVGDRAQALTYLHRAATAMNISRQSSFSCWSYLMVTAERFLNEVQQMHRMFDGEPILPEFILRASSRLH
ncbi:MAG: KGGVGR-motif variant AAA ATPase [Acidobacteriaceae bacterium]